jgi:glutamine amidotransferase
MIAVIDVGGNNLTSLGNALQRLGYYFTYTHSAKELLKASHVILPGVGSASSGMEALHANNLITTLRQLTQPFLGICLGMQLLFEQSDEGNVEGLGLIPGKVRQLNYKHGFPVPHMGWNRLQWKKASYLQSNCKDDYVYFVHSYAVPISSRTLAGCEYTEEFTAVVQQDNIVGMQFHPEKSAAVGLQLLNNFLKQEST